MPELQKENIRSYAPLDDVTLKLLRRAAVAARAMMPRWRCRPRLTSMSWRRRTSRALHRWMARLPSALSRWVSDSPRSPESALPEQGSLSVRLQ